MWSEPNKAAGSKSVRELERRPSEPRPTRSGTVRTACSRRSSPLSTSISPVGSFGPRSILPVSSEKPAVIRCATGEAL